MTNLSAPAAIADQAEAILQVFQAANPLTVPQAEKLYLQSGGPKLKKNEFRLIVEDHLLMRGQLFKCSPSGKTHRYWVHDEEQKVRETVQEVLGSKDSMAESSLATAVKKALPKISSTAAIEGYIAVMRREGLLHEWPNESKGKSKSKNPKPNPKLSLRKYDPFAGISFTKAVLKSLSSLLGKVETRGGSMGQFLQLLGQHLRPLPAESVSQPQAQNGERNDQHSDHKEIVSTPSHRESEFILPSTEIEDLILKGMRDLDSAAEQGASVLLRDLRRNMPEEYRRHETFDTAVLNLAEQERIVLHRHDQPSYLTDAERDELVRDKAGTFYISLAKRV